MARKQRRKRLQVPHLDADTTVYTKFDQLKTPAAPYPPIVDPPPRRSVRSLGAGPLLDVDLSNPWGIELGDLTIGGEFKKIGYDGPEELGDNQPVQAFNSDTGNTPFF